MQYAYFVQGLLNVLLSPPAKDSDEEKRKQNSPSREDKQKMETVSSPTQQQ